MDTGRKGFESISVITGGKSQDSQANNPITKNTILVHRNAWDYSVRMSRLDDLAAKHQSFGIIIEAPDGTISSPYIIKKSEIGKKKTVFNFLFDCEGDFDQRDIEAVKAVIFDKMKNAPSMPGNERATIQQVIKKVVNYVEENESVLGGRTYIKDGCINIETTALEKILKELECGWKKLDVLRMLRIMGILIVGEGRSYDISAVDVKGTNYHVYRFIHQLPVSAVDTKASENHTDEIS